MTEPTTYLPPPSLREYIAHYGILEIPPGTTEPYFSPPLALSGFIIQMLDQQQPIIARIQDREFFSSPAVATGQVTAPVYGQIVGPAKTILVFFQPLGMFRLFGTNMAALTNKSCRLDDFLTPHIATHLMERLKSDPQNDHQINVLNQFFLNLTPTHYPTHQLQSVLDLIHKNQGGISVSEIEHFSLYSRKTLERHFKRMVGLSPKVYCQIYRFKCLINTLHSQPGLTWAQLADAAGYYDQSHMARYVKEYLHTSPNSMVELDMAFINYLLQE